MRWILLALVCLILGDWVWHIVYALDSNRTTVFRTWRQYDVFWISYWGVALTLAVLSLWMSW